MSTRSTYRLFSSSGEKLATAVTYENTIFQVSPVKKSFPSLEAWKAEHPSNTSITEDQKQVKVHTDASGNPLPPTPPVVWKPFRKATTPSLRHLAEHKFKFHGKDLCVMNAESNSLMEIFYESWFNKAFTYKRNPDNSLEVLEFTSFTELGLPTETPDIWIGDDLLGVSPVKLPLYLPAPGQKEAFILLAGRHTSVVAAKELQKKLEDAGVLVHYGFYDRRASLKDQLWMGSLNVFKVSQDCMMNKETGAWGYVPILTHMRNKPWKKDTRLENVDHAVKIVLEE